MKTNKSRKRLCSALLCLILAVSMLPITGYADGGDIAINETNFPDAAFRTYITKFDTDNNNSLSQTEIAAVTKIDVNSDTYGVAQKISSLKGIEYFTDLEELECRGNYLVELDVSALINLKSLNCADNPEIESLDVSYNKKLTKLYCSNNMRKGKLSQLIFGENNAALDDLICDDNSLQELDISHLTALERLICNGNALTSLDASNNLKITQLDIENNQLTSLNLGKKPELFQLTCSGNQLKELALSQLSELRTLYCNDNNLKALNVDDCKIMDQLHCSNNSLTSLDIRNTALNQSTYSGALQCEENSYKIQVGEDRTFDLTTLPGNFDASKALSIIGGSINGNILTVDESATEVIYTYDCGATSKTISNPTFTLLVEKEQTYVINVENDGNGTASASVASAAQGEQVTLTAAPSEGYQFKVWEIVSGNITINDNKFTMPANPVTVKAIFEQKKYAVTVQTEGSGTASVNLTSAAKGEQVILMAAPSEGYQFKAWEIVSGNITINDNKFTMPANPVTVKAIFEQKKYAVTVQTEGNGIASVNPTSAAKGEAVTLTAAPNEGYEFDKWVVEDNKVTLANPNSPTTTFTMPASEVTIKVSFKKKAASGGSSGGGAYVPSTPPAPSSPKPSGSAITSDVSGSTSRKDGETSTKVDQSTADKLVDAAIDNKSTDIVIDTASKTENGGVPNVKASEVTLPTETIKNIAEKTDASLTIKTDVGEIKLDNKAAASVSKQGENTGAPGEQETISIIAKKVKEDTEEVRYELEIKNSGGKTISDFRGGTATITVPVPSGLQGESLICVYIDKKGHYNKVKGKWTADGRYAFSTGHFSTYAMMRESTADTVIAKQKAAVRKMTMEVRTKIVKTKSGKQAIRVTWTSGGKIIPDGVQIYRSTKKGGSFGKKPIFTTEKTRYLNTAVKTGQRYYYKVRGYVTIDGETVYTKLSGKGNRKLPETV